MSEETTYKNLSQEQRTNLFNHFCVESWRGCKIPIAYRDKKLSDIQGDYKAIIDKLVNWDFKTPLVCSLISVQNGIGKSHLAICLLKEFIRKEQTRLLEHNLNTYLNDDGMYYRYTNNLMFVPSRKILLEIRSSYNTKVTELEIVESYTKPAVLVIDDIFASKEGNDRDFERRTLLEIIDERSDYFLRPTILTGNLSLDEIANIDTRLASRMNNSMLIEIKKRMEDFRRNQ